MNASTPADIRENVAAIYRDESRRVFATLVRLLGDFDRAEEALHEAFASAVEKWPQEGVPANPRAWLVSAGRFKAIDAIRRAARFDASLGTLAERLGTETPDPIAKLDDERIDDDRLRLIFTCCHPALRTEHQVALTLRLLGGLSVAEVARSFLVSEAAMEKRLVRAKYKIKAATIPYRVPSAADLPGRIRAVLSVVYLIYNTGVDDLERGVLRSEAFRLARALVKLMPDEPEAAGLLALMLLSESRLSARRDARGLVLLRAQDRSKWNREMIAEGQALVRGCIRRAQPGPFQLQAAIQAVHCHAASFDATDWPQIVALYDHLFSVMPTPIVALNRAIAIGETEGSGAALAALDAIASDLDNYHLMHAARGTMLRRLGQREAAKGAFERAAQLAGTEADQRFLARQIEELTEDPQVGSIDQTKGGTVSTPADSRRGG